MKLIYKEKPSGFEGERQIRTFSWWEKQFCCNDMKRLWQSNRIGVDESGYIVKTSEKISLYFTDCVEDDIEYISVPVEYCPFCGDRITKVIKNLE